MMASGVLPFHPAARRVSVEAGGLTTMRHLVAVFAVCLAASAARAGGSITDEIGVATTDTTPQNPRSGNMTNNLGASFDLSDRFVLQAGISLALESATKPPQGSKLGSSASAVAAFSGSLDFDASDTVSLSLGLEVSPSSTQVSSSQITYKDNTSGAQTVANDQLRTVSSNSAIDFTASYDTAGDSNLEWGLNAGLTGNHFDTDQRIARLETAAGVVVTTQQVQASCQASGKCSPALLSALRAKPSSLDSLKLSVGGLLTAYRDTDLILGVDYYGYNQDPTTAGFFSVGAAGRTSISSGSGIPIAPLHFLTRAEVGHRWGDFSAKVWGTAGHYVDQTGQATRGIGTRIQYKFTKTFRLWASAGVQRDTDTTGNTTSSGSYALGAGYRF
jgi:hypothetical protein